MAKKPRDYRKEYDEYQGTPEQIKRRAQRNAARAKAAKEGKVHKGDGKEVDHTDHSNRRGKLDNSKVRVVSRKANRSKQPKRNGKED
jgi:hypothetical protein